MAIVTIFISAVFGLLWFLETKAAQAISPVLLTGAEAVGATALYLLFVRLTGRRKNKPKAVDRNGNSSDVILIAYASQTGVAEELARRTAEALAQGGCVTRLVEFSALDISMLTKAKTALFVASTTGEGDPPDAAVRFFGREMSSTVEFTNLRYGVLALGDSNYRDFCAFGRCLDHWLQECGASALFERIDVDRGDEEAITTWFQKLAELGAISGDTSAAVSETWRIDERRLLNPGSDNPSVFHVRLKPTGALPHWCAGDIAVVTPRNAPERIDDFLHATRLDGNASVTLRDKTMRLRDALAQLALSDSEEFSAMRKSSPQALIDALRPISPRDYSLASLPADDKAELVVRQMRYPDGSLGVGSGWLTEHADHDSEIEMRVRSNPSFHGPDNDKPMILIGAGSGIAGLRAHIKERLAAGRRANWMIFGERSAETDFLFREEIETWHASDTLYRLDLCFLENGKQRLVQDVLKAEERKLLEWLKSGAAIYVCGSRARIGVGVDNALEDIIGAKKLNVLRTSSRYRADVY